MYGTGAQADRGVAIYQPIHDQQGKRKGDRVRVARGKLCGLEGEVVTTDDGQSELVVRIDILGCAKVLISAIDIEPID